MNCAVGSRGHFIGYKHNAVETKKFSGKALKTWLNALRQQVGFICLGICYCVPKLCHTRQQICRMINVQEARRQKMKITRKYSVQPRFWLHLAKCSEIVVGSQYASYSSRLSSTTVPSPSIVHALFHHVIPRVIRFRRR